MWEDLGEAEDAVSTLSMAAATKNLKNNRQEQQQQQQQQQQQDKMVDLVDMKNKAAAAAAAAAASESGWTAYFGDHDCLSQVSFQCRAANAPSGHLLLRQDSSMLSDASSPLDGLRGSCLDQAMQESNGGGCSKRRKKEVDNQFVAAAAKSHAEDGSLVDDEACSSDCGSTMWLSELGRADANAIDVRLKVLQHLVPNADKYDSTETLDRTVDYVRCLEQKIKLLEKRIVRKHGKIDVIELQDLGLCLVPLDAAEEVLKAVTTAAVRR